MKNKTTKLPNSWIQAAIGEVVEQKVDQSGPVKSNEFRYVDISSIDNRLKRIVEPKCLASSDAPSRAKQVLAVGDVLVSMTRPNLNALAIIPEEFQGAIGSTGFDVLRTKEVDARWLYFSVQTNEFVDAMCKLVQGALYPAVRPRDIRSYVIPIAPLAEQRRIVTKIEELFTDLDAGVAALERVRANLKRYRASVLKAAVDGSLTAEWRARHPKSEPVAKLLQRVDKPPRPSRYNSRSKDIIPGHAALAVGYTGALLPPGWVWSPLVDVARMESGHTPSRDHPEWWDGDVPWIGILDAKAHHGRTVESTLQHTNAAGISNSAARVLPAGTVCVSRTAASIGYVTILGRPMATSQDFVNWVPTEAVESDWLRIVFMVSRDVLIRFGKGSTHKTVYYPEWLSMHIAVPPLREQQEIAAVLDEKLSQIEAAEQAVAHGLQRAARLRQSILQQAFTGQLVPQDPADEPASVLLKQAIPTDVHLLQSHERSHT